MTPCRVFVQFVQGPVRASWLHTDSQPGPRSRRIPSSPVEACGDAKPIGANLKPDGLRAMDRQAFNKAMLLARREALISTARHLRDQRRSKAASLAEAELRAVTMEILAMGGRDG